MFGVLLVAEVLLYVRVARAEQLSANRRSDCIPRYAFDPMEQDQIERQIERCRRLASVMTDDEVRQALERLAREYETKLRRKRSSFMLGGASQRE